jgi:hypothetical protein
MSTRQNDLNWFFFLQVTVNINACGIFQMKLDHGLLASLSPTLVISWRPVLLVGP